MTRQLQAPGVSKDAATTVWPKPFDPASPILRGWIFIGVFIGAFGAWGSTAELASTVIANGKFVVESSRKVVQHLEGGIVSKIFVRDGDTVRLGQKLVQMDTTSVAARLSTVRDQLDSSQAERARLIALRDGAPDVSFPPSFVERSVETRLTEIIRTQRTLFDAERKARQGQLDLLKKKTEITREQIAGLQAQKAARENQKRIILKEYAGLKSLFDKGLTPQTRVLALERTAAELTGEIGSLVAEIARAQKEISETDLQIVQMDNGYYFQVNDQIKQLDDDIAKQADRLKELEDVLNRSTVVAPADGRVLNMAVLADGQVLNPGAPILEIVPHSDPLVVTANIRPTDIEQVAVGQPARVRLTSLDQKYAPEVDGTVTYVSADDLEDSKTGAAYYQIRVTVPAVEKLANDGVVISAGMPAEVFVLSGTRTLLQYISSPLIDAINHSMKEK